MINDPMQVEKHVLALLIKESALFPKFAADLHQDFFKDLNNREIYTLLQKAFKSKKTLPNNKILGELLEKNNILPAQLATSLTAEFETISIMSDSPASDLEFYAQQLKDNASTSILNNEIANAKRIIDEGGSIAEVADLIQKAAIDINKIQKEEDKVAHSSNHDYLDKALENYEDTKNNPESSWGLRTGFSQLDKNTHGVEGGEMLIVAGRHGGGKSIFLLTCAINMFRQGYNVCYVTLEMPTKQMWERTICNYAALPQNGYKNGTLTADQEQHLQDQLKDFKDSKARFEIIDAPGLSEATIAVELDAIAEEHKPDVLILDYLGITKPNEKGLQDNLAQAAVVEEIRALGRKLNIPIVTASQLNRDPNKGKSKSKGTERLSRSDNLGATADIVVQIEEIDQDDLTAAADISSFHVIKNRKGEAPFSFRARRDFSCARFVDIEGEGWGYEELEENT